MKNLVYFIILLFCVQSLEGQNLKKAFKLLSENEFDKAKVLFDESVNQEAISSLGYYGNALIYSNDLYRSKDLYRAYNSIISAEKHLPNVDADQWNKLSEFVKGKEAISELKSEIEQKLFQQVKQSNTIAATERFLKEANQSSYFNAAKALYATQRYVQVQEFNTIMAYEDFIKEFPEASEAGQAQQKIFTLAFQQVAKQDKLSDYQEFVRIYPKSPQVELAKKKILEKEYELVLLTNTDDAYDRFIQKYPNTEQAAKIRIKQLEINYILAKQLNTVAVYSNFLAKFSDSDKAYEIREIRDSLAYLEAIKINTAQAYKDFISNYPEAKQVSRILELQKDLNYTKAEMAQLKKKGKISSKKISVTNFYKATETDTNSRILTQTIEYDVFGNSIRDWEKTVYGDEIEMIRTFSPDGIRKMSELKKKNGNLEFEQFFFYSAGNSPDSAHKICHQNSEDGLTTGSYSFYYSYLADGNPKSLIIIGENYKKTIYYSINNQKLIGEERIVVELPSSDAAEKLSVETKVVYQYDFNDNMIQKTTYDQHGKMVGVETYFYSSTNECSKFSLHDAKGKIRKTFQYGANGFVKSVEVECPNDPSKNHFLYCNYQFHP